jgi:predicted transcriptional regulator
MSMTVNLPDDLAARVAAEAERRGVSVEHLVAEAIASLFPAAVPQAQPKRRLAFGAIGASTSGRRAADTDEMLAEGFGRD